MTHKEIVTKLIGEIRPVGETNTDNQRLENLKVLCGLVEDLAWEIYRVGYDFKDRQEWSLKQASDYAQNFLSNTLGICNQE